MKTFKSALEFEWDKGNIEKNRKHDVGDKESEEAFLDENKVIFKDLLHSGVEERFILIGKTKKKRVLYAVFTMRKSRVRIISCRDINKSERSLYDKD